MEDLIRQRGGADARLRVYNKCDLYFGEMPRGHNVGVFLPFQGRARGFTEENSGDSGGQAAGLLKLPYDKGDLLSFSTVRLVYSRIW